MTKRPAFWIAFALVSLLAAGFAIVNFPKALPIISLDLRMDRAAALKSARSLASENHWGPAGFREVASFGVDDTVKTFVELKGGGQDAFRDMLKKGLYAAYTWRVRHFKNGEPNETTVRFTPEGTPYGFREKISETAPGPSLSEDDARRIAENEATGRWHIDLALYNRAETSRDVRTNGRADHTFVYERIHERAGEGVYRLRLVVSGDRLTELTHFLKVPESFTRRYEEMRSANNGIAFGAQAAAIVLYLLGGGAFGVFILMRKRWLLWKQALVVGAVVALLQTLAEINAWPLIWLDYNTALPLNTFFLQRIGAIIGTFLITAAYLSLSFMAAESLSRKAFPHHPQQWRLWSRDAASTKQVAGRTVAGYLYTGIEFAFIVGFYLFVTRAFHWWTPAEALVDPNILATYFPWLSALAPSVHAGMWEESLFRAVPIAGAALIGDRLGNRRAWIIAALILQAFIFGGGHANYPSEPPYARPVELILPSIAWGIIYLNFGLLTTAITHFLFDFILFSVPLFTSTSGGAKIDQTLVVLCMLVPLGIVLIARTRAGRWSELPDALRNRGWLPSPELAPEPGAATYAPVSTAIPAGRVRLFTALGVVGLLVWTIPFFRAPDTAPFHIDREQAKTRALKALADRGFTPSAKWKVLTNIEDDPDIKDDFVWRTAGHDVYHSLLGKYLDQPHWTVRAATFVGDIAERAEEWEVDVSGSGEVTRVQHRLPQGRPGATLEEPAARALAQKAVRENFNLDPATLKEVSAVSNKLPARRDWVFTFADTTDHTLKQGQLRLATKIAGDQVVDAHRYVFVPEEWDRKYTSTQSTLGLLRSPKIMFSVIVMIASAIIGIIAWSRGRFPARFTFLVFAAVFLMLIMTVFNNWPTIESRFRTDQPLETQLGIIVAAVFIGQAIFAALIALLLGLVQQRIGVEGAGGAKAPASLGIALGTLTAGVLTLEAALGRSGGPSWLNFLPAQAIVPFLSELTAPTTSFLLRVGTLAAALALVHQLTRGWTVNRALYGPLLFVFGMFVGQTGYAQTPWIWLAQGAISGIVFVALYTLVLRFDLTLVPAMLATMAALSAIRTGFLHAHASALPGALTGAVLVATIATWWLGTMRKPLSLADSALVDGTATHT